MTQSRDCAELAYWSVGGCVPYVLGQVSKVVLNSGRVRSILTSAFRDFLFHFTVIMSWSVGANRLEC